MKQAVHTPRRQGWYLVIVDTELDSNALRSLVVPADCKKGTLLTVGFMDLVDVATCDICGNDVVHGAEKRLGSVSTSSFHSDNTVKTSYVTSVCSKTQQDIHHGLYCG